MPQAQPLLKRLFGTSEPISSCFDSLIPRLSYVWLKVGVTADLKGFPMSKNLILCIESF